MSGNDASRLADIADKVEGRADELLPKRYDATKALEPGFIKACLDSNERGDGVLFATLNRGKFLFNTTPKDGEWYTWAGHVWQKDDFNNVVNAVEPCAVEYMRMAADLQKQIDDEGVESKKQDGGWKIALKEKYEGRAQRLRSRAGAGNSLFYAPIVDQSMACRESDFDRDPWALPVKNGVINLRTGVLTPGRPEDMLTRCLDIEYDPNADYTEWVEFLSEISIDEFTKGTEKIPGFLRRVIGYAATGHSIEQYIFIFIGPGRNGKGVFFNIISDILGPYYHEISRGMILEQKNEPNPNAASEHRFALLAKRIIVGAETNKGQKIDAGAVKDITGKNKINARPNYGKEVNFWPTHTLFLQTNNLPYGLTSEFSLVQRLIIIDFPFMYVDDIEAEKKKAPGLADKFRQKDSHLEEKLMKNRQGILKWIVDGAREWHENGLQIPECIMNAVDAVAKEQDYVGQFIADCLVYLPDKKDLKISTTAMYDAFEWWCDGNMKESKIPAMKTVNKALRDRGFEVEPVGGRYHLFQMAINWSITEDVAEFIKARNARKAKS